MLDFEKIYLVRHGDYNYDSSEQQLTSEGIAQSEAAGQRLAHSVMGPEATLLSSDQPRALQTAAIIALAIDSPVIPSKRVNIAGNYTAGLGSLDGMLETALEEAGLPVVGRALVVVTHRPLIMTAAFGENVKYGEIVNYKFNSWKNPEFNTVTRDHLRMKLGEAGLIA